MTTVTARFGRGRWGALAVTLACGCSAGGGAKATSIAVPWPKSGVEGASARGAVWTYAPSHAAELAGAVDLGGGKTLFFGARGERWVRDDGEKTAEAAGDLAEQDLVAAARAPSGAFTFLGARGAIFEAPSPLASFSRVIAPPEPFVRADAAGGTIAAITSRGALLVSNDGGSTFFRPKLAQPVLAGAVALEPDGHGLLLAYPESEYLTSDGGLTWSPVDFPRVGAIDLRHAPHGHVLVRGIAGTLDTHSGHVQRLPTSPVAPSFSLDVDLAPAPDAEAIREGRGFFAMDRVFVVRPPTRKEKRWSLGNARLGERMKLDPLDGTEMCERLAVTGDGAMLYVACSYEARGASLARTDVLRYANVHAPPDVLAAPLEGALGEARLATGADGELLAWGACRPGTLGGCESPSPLLLSRWESETGVAPAGTASPARSSSSMSEAASPWISVSATALSGAPLAARFGGKNRAYLVGKRGKSNDLALLVSRDGGRSFEAHDLDFGDEERRGLAWIATATISTEGDGVVSVAFEGARGGVVLLADEDGRTLSASSPPVASPTTRIGLAGRRALAVDGASAFETLDGGASWQSLGDIGSLRCDGRGPCDHRVACAASGCVIGSDVARIGWGESGASRRASDLEPPPPPPPPFRSPLPPIVCKLGKDKWTPLPTGITGAPTADAADKGKAAWALVASDPSKGSATMLHGLATTPPKIEETPLFPAARDPAAVAIHVAAQVEGGAAARVVLPRSGSPQEARTMELAWENTLEGKSGRASVSETGGNLLDLTRFRGAGLAADLAAWLSISGQGLFARADASFAPIFFADPHGKTEKIPFRDFGPRSFDDQSFVVTLEGVHVDGKSFPIGEVDGFALLRGDDAVSLFPPRTDRLAPAANELSIAYLAGEPAFVHFGFLRDVGAWQVDVFPMTADSHIVGPPLAGPTQRAAVDHLRACSAQDRAKGPRVVAPFDTGTRRAVLVDAPDGTRFASLVSDRMVLYGTRDTACVAAMDAVPVREEDAPASSGDEGDRALVYLGDLEHGWFFRTGASEATAVEARGMRCRVEANANVPPAVARALNAEVVPRR